MLGIEVPLWIEIAIFCLCFYVAFIRKDRPQPPDAKRL